MIRKFDLQVKFSASLLQTPLWTFKDFWNACGLQRRLWFNVGPKSCVVDDGSLIYVDIILSHTSSQS